MTDRDIKKQLAIETTRKQVSYLLNRTDLDANERAQIEQAHRILEHVEKPTGDLRHCICYGNWHKLVEECDPIMDKLFIEKRTGDVCRFFGLVWGGDDYYYGMYATSPEGVRKEYRLRLLSCVGRIGEGGHDYIPLVTPAD